MTQVTTALYTLVNHERAAYTEVLAHGDHGPVDLWQEECIPLARKTGARAGQDTQR
jgi:hypothetical protein